MKKALIFILAYNAEKHITSVLERIPQELWQSPEYIADVLVIDDCSKDNTAKVAKEYLKTSKLPIKVLRNNINQGYGGNQKIGYTYAIKNGYDAVVMVHGDGQYPPEAIPQMFAPILNGEANAVFGSRMINKKDALAGGMPKYKFIGNIVLTKLQNLFLGSSLSEFHSGFRAYSVEALKKVPFQHNSNNFDFDTDIIIQFVDNKLTINEIPIPTRYGDEICHVNGTKYAIDIMLSTLKSRIQKYGILHEAKFDYEHELFYPDKTNFISSHSFALSHVQPKERVLDIGAGEGYVAAKLRQQDCKITACDWRDSEAIRANYDNFLLMDINQPYFDKINAEDFDKIMLLDIIEHLHNPELFFTLLHDWCVKNNPQLIVTTPNIAFFIPRLMLLIGQFNYGKRGTLDFTHTRLFTFSSLKRLVREQGFNIVSIEGIPAPFPIAFGNTILARILLKINSWLIKLSPSLFSYQIAAIIKPMPSLEVLLEQALEQEKI